MTLTTSMGAGTGAGKMTFLEHLARAMYGYDDSKIDGSPLVDWTDKLSPEARTGMNQRARYVAERMRDHPPPGIRLVDWRTALDDALREPEPA